MSTDTKPAPKNAYATWDRGVRKSMDDFKTDGSTILIKIAADEKETTFRVRTLLTVGMTFGTEALLERFLAPYCRIGPQCSVLCSKMCVTALS